MVYEIWGMLVVLLLLFGLLSNGLLLASVFYATMKNQHNFHGYHWISSAIFILNIAIVDFLYCSFSLANASYSLYVAMQTSSENWDPENSFVACKIITLGRQNLAFIDGWSTALITFNAAFPKIW